MSPSGPSVVGGRAGGRGPRPVPWYRKISVKLALGLGLAMFSIQFFASILIIEGYRSAYDELDQGRGGASDPYAQYLSTRLTVDEQNHWVPTDEAREVIETFLGPGDNWVWVSPDEHILAAGESALKFVTVGEAWKDLCDSREYCGVTLPDGRTGGSTWTPLGISGQHIGSFVLFWLSDPAITARLGQQQLRADLASRLIVSALVATLTSILLVSIVTRRLSKLAADASTPMDASPENVDLPGPFEVAGDDEIARLAVALNTMRDRITQLVGRLADRDRQRREWIAQVSHDLRTPLTALSACLDRAIVRYDGRDDGANHGLIDALGVARQDSHRLQTLVDDLFELARLDAGEELTLEPVPPGELVRQAVRGLRPMAEARGVTMTAEVARALPTVRADGRRLMRALENLLRNAVHFAKREVTLSVRTENGGLMFEVCDDGPGLPTKDGAVTLGQSHTGARRPDSAGLGLIVTRRVATAHGGELGGRNRAEGGAAVWISIPVVPA